MVLCCENVDSVFLNAATEDDFFQGNDAYGMCVGFRYLSHFEMETANCSPIIFDMDVTPVSGSQLSYPSCAMFDRTCSVILHSSGK